MVTVKITEGKFFMGLKVIILMTIYQNITLSKISSFSVKNGPGLWRRTLQVDVQSHHTYCLWVSSTHTTKKEDQKLMSKAKVRYVVKPPPPTIQV